MSLSGPSPLGTLMVQRVEAALGNTISQQANIASGARPDAVTQPGQPDNVDPAKNPPPKEHEGARAANDQGGRQAALKALTRNDPEIAKLLAARNAPMTAYTASAPTSLGNAAKAILALFHQFPEARPAVPGRAPLFSHTPGQASGATPQGSGTLTGSMSAGAGTAGSPAPGVGGQLDPRAIQALTEQAQGGAQAAAREAATAGSNAAARPAGGQAPQAGASASGAAPTHTAGTSAPMGSLPIYSGMVTQLASALSHALQGSGLFYEAHLREFAFGQRSFAQLSAEPQAQAGQDSARAAHAETAGRAASESASPNTTQDTTQTSSSQPHPQGHASAQLAGALLGMDPSTHAIVRQQLETLATQSFAWQGEAWPGADMEWEVRRREPQEGGDHDLDSWATRLKLHLPGLGEVQARLSLAGTQLVLHLVSQDGAALMADHTDTLRHRLQGQGLQLSQLTIAREEHTEERPAP
jgi:Flagellar hook-length control protein FliK.